jgi:hypothetical protein
LGNDIAVPQARLVDSAVRLGLLADLSWGEVMGAERLVKDGAPHPAIDVFLKASKQHAATLQMLGLEQRVRNVTLSDVLEGRVEHES